MSYFKKLKQQLDCQQILTVQHVGVAAKIVNKKVNKAGLVDILGEAGDINVQGEEQKKLDVFANDQFIAALRSSGECCGIASEENQEIITFDDDLARDGNYIFCMQDLEIRGAGNLLGGEQSGFIADIGFETYHKILNEAIQEMKEGEFKDVFKEEMEKKIVEGTHNFAQDCHIETDMDIILPDKYIGSTTEKIKLYRELDNLQDEEAIQRFQTMLQDRFGTPPTQVNELLNVVRLRWNAMIPRTEIEGVDLKTDIEDIRTNFIRTNFSRLLVFQESRDNIIGYLNSKDLFHNPQSIEKMLKEVDFIPETMPAHKLLTNLIKSHKNLAIVVDEFGGTAGMIA